MKYELQYRPASLHGTYGVNYYFQKGNGDKQRLQFEVEVQYCGQYLNDYSIYHLTKHRFVINRGEDGKYLYDIMLKCASVIYPIAVLVDTHGKIVYIKDSDVREKWVELRAELDRYYKGSTAEEYLNKIEAELNSGNICEKMIIDDLFFGQLFAINYGCDKTTPQFQREIKYTPFAAPLTISCQQTVDLNGLADSNLSYFNVSHKGETETCSKYGLISKDFEMDTSKYNAKVSAALEVSYEFDKNSLSLEGILGDYSMSVDGELFSCTRVEAYKLEEKPIEFGKDEEFERMEKEFLKKEHSLSNKLKNFFNK